MIVPVSRFLLPPNGVLLEENKLSVPELVTPELKSKDFSFDAESCLSQCNLELLAPPKSNEDDDRFLEESPKPNLDDVELLFRVLLPSINGARFVPVLTTLTSY